MQETILHWITLFKISYAPNIKIPSYYPWSNDTFDLGIRILIHKTIFGPQLVKLLSMLGGKARPQYSLEAKDNNYQCRIIYTIGKCYLYCRNYFS